MNNSEKKLKVPGIVLLAASIFSLVGAAVYVFTDKMLPVPLSEWISFLFAYRKAGSVSGTVICTIIYAATIAATILIASNPKFRKVFVFVPASIVYVIDVFVLMYAFLFATGYSWGYLISALLDICVIILMLRKEK